MVGTAAASDVEEGVFQVSAGFPPTWVCLSAEAKGKGRDVPSRAKFCRMYLSILSILEHGACAHLYACMTYV